MNLQYIYHTSLLINFDKKSFLNEVKRLCTNTESACTFLMDLMKVLLEVSS